LVVLSPHLAYAHATDGAPAGSLSLADLAGVRQTETVSVALQSAGVLTLEDLHMLDEEELSELKTSLRECGAVLSDRTRLRQLWQMDQFEIISHVPPFEGTKTPPEQVLGTVRQLQEGKADGGGTNVETLAIVC
jgi:hypothetical protein